MSQDKSNRSPIGDAPAMLRRKPMQQRSRDRVERMLSAAVQLIERDGSDALRMNDLAEIAGVSIGSLYQYFPDKAAIVRSLAERSNREGRACIEGALAPVRTDAQFRAAFARLIDIYYGIFLDRPVMRDIWSATQADARLRAFELTESRANGAIVADTLARLRPDADRARLETAAFFVMSLGEATMRLAISVDRKEGADLVEIYKRMALDALQAALDE
ncbi:MULTISPECIES: TetR/AcrR family transcriptional regulator [Rhodomicrobium]|uniref:TetR/AcrR family transcriptional regulator n=1 Tax=Rhodomicrobium TaxID=1068 RepID=UPI001FDA1265|nr:MULTISPECIES: TetR/AcrR family transcriptional regulator [Rhodomicrobium]